MLVTVAIGTTDAVVAYSELALSPAPNKDVWQWGTLVHREHRGHRLGLALKARNLQRLTKVAPDRSRVLTCNAQTNRHMADINERLGFDAVEVVPMLRLSLDATDAVSARAR